VVTTTAKKMMRCRHLINTRAVKFERAQSQLLVTNFPFATPRVCPPLGLGIIVITHPHLQQQQQQQQRRRRQQHPAGSIIPSRACAISDASSPAHVLYSC
jgi:hypothetical protein